MMNFMIIVDTQILIEIHNSPFAGHTIIQENSILLSIGETTNVYLPAGMPESVLLYFMDTKIGVEIHHLHIRRTTLLLPILQDGSTQITSIIRTTRLRSLILGRNMVT